MNGLYIPVTWIYEQIKKNPGRHASSWSYLLDLWDKKLLKDMDDEKADPDDYIRIFVCTRIRQQHRNFGGMNNDGCKSTRYC